MTDTREDLLNDKLDYLNETKYMIKDVLEEMGVTILEQDTFRDYVEKIKDIDTSDVKVFETEQEMREYENPKENMLAIVYKSYLNNLGTSEYAQYLIFPEEVTLNEECISNYNAELKNKNNTLVGSVYITPVSFYININRDIDLEINYISEDGINYSRVDTVPIPFDILNSVVFNLNATAPELKWFQPFIKYNKDIFNGLFRYINNNYIYIESENEKNLNISLSEVEQLVDTIRGE